MVPKYTFDTYIIYIAKVVDAFIALVSEFLASDNKKSEQILEKKTVLRRGCKGRNMQSQDDFGSMEERPIHRKCLCT